MDADKRTDHVSPQVRSAIMRAVRSQSTKSTEKRIRAALVSKGITGWHLQSRNLPGKPDIVFPSKKIAVFVDGCFWHGCPKCYRRPHSNQDYWDNKVLGNKNRDRLNTKALKKNGWDVLRFWEHDIIANPSAVCNKIEELLIRKIGT